MRRTLIAIGSVLAAMIAVRPAHAQSCPSDEATSFIAPGVLLSWDLSHGGTFGFGAEFSYAKWLSAGRPSGVGAFTNVVYYPASDRTRFAAGAQANELFAGMELGYGYLSRSNASETPSYGGPLFGAFASTGYLLLAFRGTFQLADDRKVKSDWSFDIGGKLPMSVSHEGVHPYCADFNL